MSGEVAPCRRLDRGEDIAFDPGVGGHPIESGIGEATAHHLAVLGAAVVLGARRTDRLDRSVAEIEAAGGRAIAVRVDVTEPAVARAIAFAIDRPDDVEIGDLTIRPTRQG